MIIDEEVKRAEREPGQYDIYPHNIQQALGVGLYFIIFSLIAGLIIGIAVALYHVKDKTATSAINGAGYLAAAIATIWFSFYRYRKLTGVPYKLKLNRFAFWPVLLSVIMILTMPVIADPVSIIFPMSDEVKKFFDDMFHADIYTYLLAIVAAPIVEEIIFRGIILNGLLKKYSPQTAIIVSALVFAIIHGNPWQAIPAFLGGLLMGWMYWKTNSIIPGMILHFVNNLFSTFADSIFPALKNVDTIKQLVSTPVYIGIYLACAAILMSGWALLERYFENNPTDNDEEFEPELVTEE